VGRRSIRARALVDSGADQTLMPATWLATLGIAGSPNEVELVATASGTGQLLIFDAAVELTIVGCTRSVSVGAFFAEGVPFMLLGRADFFHAFRVLFDERAQTVTLTEYDDEPSLPFAA
jgi:hypothetical protein